MAASSIRKQTYRTGAIARDGIEPKACPELGGLNGTGGALLRVWRTWKAERPDSLTAAVSGRIDNEAGVEEVLL
ncbi:hypothetical protein TRAPUB_261 [Trametes pubescens]|uniref:Uncharacterized protein n=1 Tax=Trametes pubescens TaxID=154538 RepID=A0A1M2VMK8_TRAPU|nr:hypothetical protein TRAPUB_261 [Trametes pubescens]